MQKHVLFVDDEEVILMTLEGVFPGLGYLPHCTTDGEDAIRLLKQYRIRVCFLDLRMPKIDGMKLCRQIKDIDPDSCVYALSGFIDAFTPSQFADAGFDGRFRKPFKIDALNDACHRAFDKLERLEKQQGAEPPPE